MSKVTAMDVIQYFKDADLEVAELALHVATTTVAAKSQARKEASDRMAKARAGRGKGKATASAAAAAPAVPATAQAEAPAAVQPGQPGPIAEARARRAHVPRVEAPARTAAATSVESDTEVLA